MKTSITMLLVFMCSFTFFAFAQDKEEPDIKIELVNGDLKIETLKCTDVVAMLIEFESLRHDIVEGKCSKAIITEIPNIKIELDKGKYTITMALEPFMNFSKKLEKNLGIEDITPASAFGGEYWCIHCTGGFANKPPKTMFESSIWIYARAYAYCCPFPPVNGYGFTITKGKCK